MPTDELTVDQKELEEIMAKYDRESATRSFIRTGKGRTFKLWRWELPLDKWTVTGLIVGLICLVFSLVQLYAAFTANIPATQVRPLHLGFVMVLAFLLYPATKKMKRVNNLPWYDVALAVLAMACCLYIALQHVELAMRSGKYTIWTSPWASCSRCCWRNAAAVWWACPS